MKHNAKSRGSGGRLRLTLLLATAAAFLLVPAASASADVPGSEIVFAGEGSGWVKGAAGAEGGEPHVECHWNGTAIDVALPPASGKCEFTAKEISGLNGVNVGHEADPGSQFGSATTGWKVLSGTPVSCPQDTETAGGCAVLWFGGPPIKIQATFTKEPPKFKLKVAKNGTGSGTVTSSPAGINCGVDCEEEYKEGTLVKLTGTPSTGSKAVVWESCPGTVNGSNECEVTMSAAKEAKATFDLIPESFSVTVEGEGKVECEDNGGGLKPCASSYLYGHTIKVVATAAAENAVESLTGTGSAAGKCEKTEATGSCTFEIKETSSVTAKFKSKKIRSEAKVETVHGEVPQTTTLESACSEVDLGKFIPGVTADYNKTCGVKLTSTGEETTLAAKDESATHTGHLVQGSYFLPSALKAKATDSEAKGTGPGLTALKESNLESLTLLTFKVPVSKDASTVEFSQHIGEHDGLHTGVYSKTITLILEQIKP